ncbi:MAG: hypothetical protein AAF074_16490 [Pseudomonadota bacterium]
MRPPHWSWGPYYWYPAWGWYFTATVAGAALVYVATLPDDKACEEVDLDGETLYLCDGVLYRATYYEDELVYEIVTEPEGGADAAPAAAAEPAPAAEAPAQAQAPEETQSAKAPTPASGTIRVDEDGFNWAE